MVSNKPRTGTFIVTSNLSVLCAAFTYWMLSPLVSYKSRAETFLVTSNLFTNSTNLPTTNLGVVLLEPVHLLGVDHSVLLVVAGVVVGSPRLVLLVRGLHLGAELQLGQLDLFTTSSFFYLLDRHFFMSA